MSLKYALLQKFPYQDAPKVLLNTTKDIIFIMELYKLHEIERKSTRCSLGSKTQNLCFWNNYSKLALKNYIGVLQHGLPYCVNFVGKFEKFTKVI